MKSSILTIRLDQALVRQLTRAAKRSGRSRSELVRDALRRQLALAQLDDLRRRSGIRGLCADIVNAALAEHQLIIGPTVLAELQQFLLRKLRFPATVVDEVIAFLRLNATIIAAAPELAIRGLDENDRALLAETIAGNANVLVTGDQELLKVVAPFFAFRGLVMASPLWYPNLPERVRQKLFAFIQSVMDTEAFDLERVNAYCGD